MTKSPKAPDAERRLRFGRRAGDIRLYAGVGDVNEFYERNKPKCRSVVWCLCRPQGKPEVLAVVTGDGRLRTALFSRDFPKSHEPLKVEQLYLEEREVPVRCPRCMPIDSQRGMPTDIWYIDMAEVHGALELNHLKDALPGQRKKQVVALDIRDVGRRQSEIIAQLQLTSLVVSEDAVDTPHETLLSASSKA